MIMVSKIFYRTVAVVCFLDVSVVWLDSVRQTTLNKLFEKKKVKRFKRLVRVFELFVLLSLLAFIIRLITTNGRSYNIFISIIMAVLAATLVVLFFYGRSRIISVLLPTTEKTKVKTQSDIAAAKYVFTIRATAAAVIFANLGVLAIQIYSIVMIQNFPDLVAANNSSVIHTL